MIEINKIGSEISYALYHKIPSLVYPYLFINKIVRSKIELPMDANYRIIYYHSVSNKNKELFENQIRYLNKNYTIVELDEIISSSKELNSDKKYLSITFDDGFLDNYTVAFPILKKLSIPATFFITPKLIEMSCRDKVDYKKYFKKHFNKIKIQKSMTWDQIRELNLNGYDIGCHGYTHKDIGKIGNDEEMQKEITYTKSIIENELNKKVKYFAFPYGKKANISEEAVIEVIKSGYKACFSADRGWNIGKKCIYYRDGIEPWFKPYILKSILNGEIDHLTNIHYYNSINENINC